MLHSPCYPASTALLLLQEHSPIPPQVPQITDVNHTCMRVHIHDIVALHTPVQIVGKYCTDVHTPIQTVGTYGTDVHTPIQTVIQTVVKNGTDVQTMRRVKVIKFTFFNPQQSVRLYDFSQWSV